jgi:O-antigen ligase
MTFRAERWQEDLSKFAKFDLENKIFGLGPGGAVQVSERVYRQSGFLKHQLISHNGYILILLERGIVGLLIFLFLIISLSLKSIKYLSTDDIIFPMAYLLMLLAIYSFAQNSELTNPYTFLIIGTVIGNLVYSHLNEEESETIEEHDPLRVAS